MAVNKFKPHIYLIPEDDANRQVAIGFEKDDRLVARAVQVMPNAGGWKRAIAKLDDEYLAILRSNAYAHVVVLIDSDDETKRIPDILESIPKDLRDRIFVLGALREPESLKAEVKIHFEKIGEQLADECSRDELRLWLHAEFKHISSEIQRAKNCLRPIIFKND